MHWMLGLFCISSISIYLEYLIFNLYYLYNNNLFFLLYFILNIFKNVFQYKIIQKTIYIF